MKITNLFKEMVVEGVRAYLFAAGADADQGMAGHGAPGVVD
jgi:hypothetical protein